MEVLFLRDFAPSDTGALVREVEDYLVLVCFESERVESADSRSSGVYRAAVLTQEKAFALLSGLFHFIGIRRLSFQFHGKIGDRSPYSGGDVVCFRLQEEDVSGLLFCVAAADAALDAFESHISRVFKAHCLSPEMVQGKTVLECYFFLCPSPY